MTPKPLPDAPSLDHLKKQAKSLLKDARDRQAAALARFAELPSWTNIPVDQIDVTELALHDAQSVIAREYGFVSWNALREEGRHLQPASLPTRETISSVWTQLKTEAARQERSIFETSSEGRW